MTCAERSSRIARADCFRARLNEGVIFGFRHTPRDAALELCQAHCQRQSRRLRLLLTPRRREHLQRHRDVHAAAAVPVECDRVPMRLDQLVQARALAQHLSPRRAAEQSVPLGPLANGAASGRVVVGGRVGGGVRLLRGFELHHGCREQLPDEGLLGLDHDRGGARPREVRGTRGADEEREEAGGEQTKERG